MSCLALLGGDVHAHERADGPPGAEIDQEERDRAHQEEHDHALHDALDVVRSVACSE